jgi:hypothetical protein
MGTKFKKFSFFEFFGHQTVKNSQIYNQIRIQMIKFKFKQINQEVTPHYRPPAPVIGGSAGGIAQTVAPGSALTRALPPAPDRR